MKITEAIEKHKAVNIRRLVIWHKKTCHKENCGINVFLLLEDFERHIGRKANEEEFDSFM
jgi:hypothetical protein